jgi:hypothetical protein
MKTFTLVKGNTTVSIRVGITEAEMKRTVDGHRDTTTTTMKPVEALRTVNELIRQGYASKANA